MSKVSKELLRNYVKEQQFSTPDDILGAMKGKRQISPHRFTNPHK